VGFVGLDGLFGFRTEGLGRCEGGGSGDGRDFSHGAAHKSDFMGGEGRKRKRWVFEGRPQEAEFGDHEFLVGQGDPEGRSDFFREVSDCGVGGERKGMGFAMVCDSQREWILRVKRRIIICIISRHVCSEEGMYNEE